MTGLKERTKTMARDIRTRKQNFRDEQNEGRTGEKPEYKPRGRRGYSKVILDVTVDKVEDATKVANWVAEFTKENPQVGVICKIEVGE